MTSKRKWEKGIFSNIIMLGCAAFGYSTSTLELPIISALFPLGCALGYTVCLLSTPTTKDDF